MHTIHNIVDSVDSRLSIYTYQHTHTPTHTFTYRSVQGREKKQRIEHLQQFATKIV